MSETPTRPPATGGTESPSTGTMPPPLGAGRLIGPYRLLQRLGEGGMGEVWLAEQQEPVRRKVALKLIKRGLDTRQVVARFEAERQALALMAHPCVAKVFDAGVTPDGRPYFAMEHVQGVPITEYCDRHRLTIAERLRVFVGVCEGVQHAHQKAIIHRDLKPSNVLVTEQDGRAAPKIIDFGVAKATAQRLTERSLFTEQGVLIGTPEYMSPEQAKMTAEDVDTRTDVYALGVVLYELLVGALPFDSKVLRAAGFDGIRRKILEEEPPRPSARLGTMGEATATETAGRRRVDRRTLRRQLAGDLDWVTMKALEKDRARRYGSPTELAQDITRHLMNEPVLAGPPGVAYRARKFIRRHRVGVGIATAATFLLLAFAASMTWQAERIARERDRADREARTANQALKFLTGLFKVSNPDESRGSVLTAREILDRGKKRLASELADDPLIQAKMMLTIGEVYRNLGEYKQAAPLVEQSLSLRRKFLGGDHPDTLASIAWLGAVLLDQGKTQEAEPYLKEALEGRRRVLGNDHRDTLDSLNTMGGLLYSQGKNQEAEAYLREALQGFRRVLGNEHPDTLKAIRNVGTILSVQGKLREAEPYFKEALEGRRRTLGKDHPDTLESIDDMGYLLREQGKLQEAGPYFHEALEGRRRVLGKDHPDTLSSIDAMGSVLRDQGKVQEAEQYFEEALEGRRRALGNDHPDTLNGMLNVGWTLTAEGKLAEAEPYYLEALQGTRRVLGNDHSLTFEAMSGMYGLRRRQGRLKEAEGYLRQALEGRRRVLGDDNPETLASINSLGYLLYRQGRFAEAEPYLREAVDRSVRVRGKDHPGTLDFMVNLGELYTTQGRLQEAEPLLEDAVARARALPPGNRVVGEALGAFGRWLTLMRRYTDAEAALLEGHKTLATIDAELAHLTEEHLVALYEAWGRPAEAALWRRDRRSSEASPRGAIRH